MKSLRSTREETLLEIQREEERLNLARKRREDEEMEIKRVEEEGGMKAEERMLVEKVRVIEKSKLGVVKKPLD